MRIAISLEEGKIESKVDRRVGRAPYFLIMDMETKEYEIVENQAKDEVTGAGLKVVKNLIDLEVDELIAGEIGPKAQVLIEEFELPVYKLGEFENVEDVIKAYEEKKLEKFDFSKPTGLRMA